MLNELSQVVTGRLRLLQVAAILQQSVTICGVRLSEHESI